VCVAGIGKLLSVTLGASAKTAEGGATLPVGTSRAVRPRKPRVGAAQATSEGDRAYLRGRIAVAFDLALGNSHVEARRLLAGLQPDVDTADNEIAALYFHACALTYYKARLIRESFAAFERALTAARNHTDPRLRHVILENYGCTLTQDGRTGSAVDLLTQGLEIESDPVDRLLSLMNFAEALFAAGHLRRAADVLHEFHALHASHPKSDYLLTAAVTGIPVAMMLGDKQLLRLSCDPALVELAFVRPGQHQVLGQAAEAFCLLYEHSDRRTEHDALLDRTVDALSSLDASLGLALRVARLGSADQVLRVKTLIDQHCAADTVLLRSYRALFDGFIASRHQLTQRARKLAMQAVRDLAGVGRPFLEAVALEAAGLHDAARSLRRRCGGTGDAMRLKWMSGALPRRMATDLTSREREVAKLAARGTTDRAIALALGLSERTVQCHCRAIFGKLGIRSRWQLSGVLMETTRVKSISK
jgi:DNA-binding NarL/FixJ family response regulator